MSELLEILSHTDSKNRKTLDELSEKTGLTKRKVRSQIEDYRFSPVADHYPICSEAGKSGYWWGTPSEWVAFEKMYQAYKNTYNRNCRYMKRQRVMFNRKAVRNA